MNIQTLCSIETDSYYDGTIGTTVISIKIYPNTCLSVVAGWTYFTWLGLLGNYCEIVIRIELVKLVNPVHCLGCSWLPLAGNDILNLTADSSRLPSPENKISLKTLSLPSTIGLDWTGLSD